MSDDPAAEEEQLDSLRALLGAISLYSPEVGYCQGMNYVAAMLLRVLPEERAFWVMVGLMRHLELPELYSPGPHPHPQPPSPPAATQQASPPYTRTMMVGRLVCALAVRVQACAK